MNDDHSCRLKLFDLQETLLPQVRLSDNFTICTWKVRAKFAFYTNSVIIIVDRVDRVVGPERRVGSLSTYLVIPPSLEFLVFSALRLRSL